MEKALHGFDAARFVKHKMEGLTVTLHNLLRFKRGQLRQALDSEQSTDELKTSIHQLEDQLGVAKNLQTEMDGILSGNFEDDTKTVEQAAAAEKTSLIYVGVRHPDLKNLVMNRLRSKGNVRNLLEAVRHIGHGAGLSIYATESDVRSFIQSRQFDLSTYGYVEVAIPVALYERAVANSSAQDNLGNVLLDRVALERQIFNPAQMTCLKVHDAEGYRAFRVSNNVDNEFEIEG